MKKWRGKLQLFAVARMELAAADVRRRSLPGAINPPANERSAARPGPQRIGSKQGPIGYLNRSVASIAAAARDVPRSVDWFQAARFWSSRTPHVGGYALICVVFFVCALLPIQAADQWNIVWSDEFGGATIATTNWAFETGNNGGWGNAELEYYTSRTQNAYVSNGLLNIVARQESFGGFNYTSARMKSQNHFSKQYGRLEFRAKMPSGIGFWPALWMLGNNFPSVGWPACGEIDIMENKGGVPGQVQGTIHYSNASNQHVQSSATYNFPAGNGATNFHTYLLDWATNSIKWYVDGQLYQTRTSWTSSTGPYPAPFNQPFYFIMNLAVGGNYLGNPDTNSINTNAVWPGVMQVDYVRVYDLTPPFQLGISMSNGNVLLSWPSAIVSHLQAQTNSLSTNWFDVPGASTPYVVPAAAANSVFYRLRSP